jgi:cytochrome c-type biogenesis protein CcmE
VELSPRTGPDDTEADDTAPDGAGSAPRRGRRRWLPLAVVLVVVVLGGFLVARGLSDAALYFRNADEAVAERDALGTRRFRLQGTVVGEPERRGDTVSFEVAYGGVSVPVDHVGDPPELFRPGIPVVLEGHFEEGSDTFASDRIMVKHDEEYRAREDYDERRGQAEDGADGGGTTP